MKKLLMKFMLRNLEDIVDFFESLQQRLQEHVDAEYAASERLNKEADELVVQANAHKAKATKAEKLVKALPTVN